MEALGINPASLVGLGGLSLVLFVITVMALRGKFWTDKAHSEAVQSEKDHAAAIVAVAEAHAENARRDAAALIESMRAEMTSRMENFRADHALRMDQVREDHEKQLAALALVTTGVREDFDRVISSKQRDADDWRGAYHIGAENWKLSEDRMDEVLETLRLINSVVSAALPPRNGGAGDG